jgi:DNA-directed RNA polymerase subunit RPC12/RpoP/uncharacterized membrane protein
MFARITLILWLVSSAFIIILLGKIDNIVNGDLYNYGLQFSLVWASPYWVFARLIYVLLAIPMIFSFVALASGLLNRGNNNGRVRITRREVKKENENVQAAKNNSVLMTCPKCGKLFGRPLTMLNFSSGKTRLVNVCPYCNHILGDAEEGSHDNIHIADPTKQKVEQK